jgi:hypothetical protein
MSKNVLPTESCASEKGTWETMTPEKKEPRQFWIKEAFRGDSGFKYPPHVTTDPTYASYEAGFIHVIEHSAYRELEEANKRLGAAIEKLFDDLTNLYHSEISGGKGATMAYEKKVRAEINAILNPTMEK